MGRPYRIYMEVGGQFASFRDPSSGSGIETYPVPTYSQAKGIMECIAMQPGAYIHPTSVEICFPLGRMGLTFNYMGPLRKSTSTANGDGAQISMTVLVDPCYRIYATVEADPRSCSKEKNAAHCLQAKFIRRLKNGQCLRRPCLGISDFPVTYFGSFREEIKVASFVNIKLRTMTKAIFNEPFNGKYAPSYYHNVFIRRGVMHYA